MKTVTHEHLETLLPLLEGPGMEVIACYGEEKATWSIPKAVLSHHSEFFRAACNGPFREGVENKITLQNCHPKAFQGFVHWLYFGVLPSRTDNWDEVWGSFHLWVLGDRFLVADFKNAVMQDLYDIHSPGKQCYILPCEVDYSWSYTTGNSALRRFILDVVSYSWKDHFYCCAQQEWVELFEKFPEFEHDLLCRLGSDCARPLIEDYTEEIKKTTHDER